MRAWLQLLRAPNLFTVPGDPLAGMMLALAVMPGAGFSLSRALAVAAAGLLLYSGGLIQNDLCDLAEDRRERPSRPLPIGAISKTAAVIAAILLPLSALGAASLAGGAALVIAAVLACAILLYNLLTKPIAVIGPLNMGACRGLNLLLGAAALGWQAVAEPAVHVSGGFMLAYIAAVTQIARVETRAVRVGSLRLLPALVLVLWFLSLNLLVHPADLPPVIGANVLALLTVVWSVSCTAKLKATASPPVVQEAVGLLIRGLLLIQAALAAMLVRPGFIVTAVLLAFWPVQAKLARRFYSS